MLNSVNLQGGNTLVDKSNSREAGRSKLKPYRRKGREKEPAGSQKSIYIPIAHWQVS